MKTQFKVFKSTWGYHTIEDLIKEYQEEHHLEVRNVVVLRSTEEGLVVGAIFEEDIVSNFNSKYRDSIKGAINGFMSYPEPGG